MKGYLTDRPMVASKTLRVAAKLADFLMSKQLAGIVELDETWCKYSEQSSRHVTDEKHRKRGNDKASNVSAVIGMDRSGHVVSQVLVGFKLSKCDADCLPKLDDDLVLCTDDHSHDEYLAEQEKSNHVALNKSLGWRVFMV